MAHIQIDLELQAAIGRERSPVELRDSTGKVVGFALSRSEMGMLRMHKDRISQINYYLDEKIDPAAFFKIVKASRTYTHKEVMKKLGFDSPDDSVNQVQPEEKA